MVGRKSATDKGYPAYSKSMKSLNVTWAPASLDKFLSEPTKMAPGTAMPINVPSAQDRKNVIAYLASLKKTS